VTTLWPTGGRDDEPDTLALLGSLLWQGACRAGVEDLASQRLSLSHVADHDRLSPWSGRRMARLSYPRSGASRSMPA
jgi:hypothetical protein